MRSVLEDTPRLLNYLLEFAKRNDYEVEMDIINKHLDVSFDDIKSFTDKLNLHARGNPIELRDYQVEAVKTALDKERTLLLSPTASGKSFIIYTTMRWHVAHDRKIGRAHV